MNAKKRRIELIFDNELYKAQAWQVQRRWASGQFEDLAKADYHIVWIDERMALIEPSMEHHIRTLLRNEIRQAMTNTTTYF